MVFNIALSYGGRAEIVDAARRAMRSGVDPESLDEQTFASFLYTAGQPDPDLLIRTSGEMRVSNFLLWQIAYAEIWVTDALWPDFRARHLLEAHRRLSEARSPLRRDSASATRSAPVKAIGRAASIARVRRARVLSSIAVIVGSGTIWLAAARGRRSSSPPSPPRSPAASWRACRRLGDVPAPVFVGIAAALACRGFALVVGRPARCPSARICLGSGAHWRR